MDTQNRLYRVYTGTNRICVDVKNETRRAAREGRGEERGLFDDCDTMHVYNSRGESAATVVVVIVESGTTQLAVETRRERHVGTGSRRRKPCKETTNVATRQGVSNILASWDIYGVEVDPVCGTEQINLFEDVVGGQITRHAFLHCADNACVVGSQQDAGA